jgi:hypothetical protein
MHLAVIVPRAAFDLHPLAGANALHWRVQLPHGAQWLEGGRAALMPGDSFRVTYSPGDAFVLDVEPTSGLACGDATCTGLRCDNGDFTRCVACAVYESDAEAAEAVVEASL